MTPDPTNIVIAGSLAVVIAGTLALAAMQDHPEARSPGWDEPPSPYEACLLTADTPGPSGFASEVCEPLSPFYVDPVVLLYPRSLDPGGCGTARGVRWCPVNLTPDKAGCLTFTYAMLHAEPQEKWGDPGDGEVFCAD